MNFKLIFVYVLFDCLEGKVKENIGETIITEDVNAKSFGAAVAINSKYIIIANTADSVGRQLNVGSVSVYENKDGHPLVKKLFPDDGESNDRFGSSVALNDRYIVVGSSLHDVKYEDQGSVYIYDTDGGTWSYKKIVLYDGGENDRFGNSVDINDEDEIVIGAPFSDMKGKHSGAAYVYSYNGKTWQQKQKLIPSDLSHGDLLGHTVSITKDYIAITREDKGPVAKFYRSGSVHIYRKNRQGIWVKDAKLTSPNPSWYGTFGHSVSIEGRYLVIGATNEDVMGNAYVYVNEGNTWKYQSKLMTEDNPNHFHYGTSVAIHKTTIIVASLYDDIRKTGFAHVFKLSNGKWVETGRLVDKSPPHRFGKHFVAVFDGKVVAGCRSERYNGAAFVYRV